MGSHCLIAVLRAAGQITEAEAKQALANRKAKPPPPAPLGPVDPKRAESAARSAAAFDYAAWTKAQEAL